MEVLNHSFFLRIFVYPTIRLTLKYEISEDDLFARLSKLKCNHSLLVQRILIDEINRKFWIEAGSYKIVTTFIGVAHKTGINKFIGGQFINISIFLSYALLIVAAIGLFISIRNQRYAAEMFAYLVFFAIFHIFISMRFNIHIKSILFFLERELDARVTQDEAVSKRL